TRSPSSGNDVLIAEYRSSIELRLEEPDGRPQAEREGAGMAIEITIDGVDVLPIRRLDQHRRGDAAPGPRDPDAAAPVHGPQILGQRHGPRVNRERAEASDVVVGAVVELEAEADLAHGARAQAGQALP